MAASSILIKKRNGREEPFNSNKLKYSLEKTGAGEVVVNTIVNKINKLLYKGITTSEIYNNAFKELKKHHTPFAAKYKLKKALLELGPSGYPFEKYVAGLLDFQGFKTLVGVIVQGHCVQHEVDVVAEKDNKHFMIECKFHKSTGRFCDVKIPLYIYSRFLDVEKQWRKQPGHVTKFHQGWVVTNTRFTSDAIRYGKCVGLHLISWDYPVHGSLKDRIDYSGLHPVTSLTTLSKADKQILLNNGIVFCKQLCDNPNLIDNLHLSSLKKSKILKEAIDLCTVKE